MNTELAPMARRRASMAVQQKEQREPNVVAPFLVPSKPPERYLQIFDPVEKYIPEGFQIQYEHRHQTEIRVASYNYTDDVLVTVADKCMRSWSQAGMRHRVDFAVSAFNHIKAMIFLPTFNFFLAAANDLTFEIYGRDLSLLNKMPCSMRTVLSLSFCRTRNEIIAAGVEEIRIWAVQQQPNIRYDNMSEPVVQCQIEHRKALPNTRGRWFNKTTVDEEKQELLAIYDNSLVVYSLVTCEVLYERTLHSNTVTDVVLFHEMDYLITSAVDGTIKVWDRNGNCVKTLEGHTKAVSNILLIPAFSILLSCSKDATVRLWSLQTLKEMHKLRVEAELDGMGVIGVHLHRLRLFCYSQRLLTVFDFHHVVDMFALSRARAVHLRTVDMPDHPTRIMSIAEDHSVRILSRHGRNLTVLPPVDMCALRSAEYCRMHELLVVHMTNRDVIVYDTLYSPVKRVARWSAANEYCTALGLAVGTHPPPPRDASHTLRRGPRGYFELVLGGTEDGQIRMWDPAPHGLAIGRVYGHFQAHKDEIVLIQHSREREVILSLDIVNLLRLWHVPTLTLVGEYNFGAMPRLKTLTLMDDLLFCGYVDGAVFLYVLGEPQHVALGVSRGSPSGSGSGGDELVELVDTEGQEHTAAVTATDSRKSVDLFVTCSLDGTIKLWNRHRAVYREINMSTPLEAVCFIGESGDLLVGVDEHIYIMRASAYLPTGYVRHRHHHTTVSGTDTDSDPDDGRDIIVEGVEQAKRSMLGDIRMLKKKWLDAILRWKDRALARIHERTHGKKTEAVEEEESDWGNVSTRDIMNSPVPTPKRRKDNTMQFPVLGVEWEDVQVADDGKHMQEMLERDLALLNAYKVALKQRKKRRRRTHRVREDLDDSHHSSPKPAKRRRKKKKVEEELDDIEKAIRKSEIEMDKARRQKFLDKMRTWDEYLVQLEAGWSYRTATPEQQAQHYELIRLAKRQHFAEFLSDSEEGDDADSGYSYYSDENEENVEGSPTAAPGTGGAPLAGGGAASGPASQAPSIDGNEPEPATHKLISVPHIPLPALPKNNGGTQDTARRGPYQVSDRLMGSTFAYRQRMKETLVKRQFISLEEYEEEKKQKRKKRRRRFRRRPEGSLTFRPLKGYKARGGQHEEHHGSSFLFTTVVPSSHGHTAARSHRREGVTHSSSGGHFATVAVPPATHRSFDISARALANSRVPYLAPRPPGTDNDDAVLATASAMLSAAMDEPLRPLSGVHGTAVAGGGGEGGAGGGAVVGGEADDEAVMAELYRRYNMTSPTRHPGRLSKGSTTHHTASTSPDTTTGGAGHSVDFIVIGESAGNSARATPRRARSASASGSGGGDAQRSHRRSLSASSGDGASWHASASHSVPIQEEMDEEEDAERGLRRIINQVPVRPPSGRQATGAPHITRPSTSEMRQRLTSSHQEPSDGAHPGTHERPAPTEVVAKSMPTMPSAMPSPMQPTAEILTRGDKEEAIAARGRAFAVLEQRRAQRVPSLNLRNDAADRSMRTEEHERNVIAATEKLFKRRSSAAELLKMGRSTVRMSVVAARPPPSGAENSPSMTSREYTGYLPVLPGPERNSRVALDPNVRYMIFKPLIVQPPRFSRSSSLVSFHIDESRGRRSRQSAHRSDA